MNNSLSDRVLSLSINNTFVELNFLQIVLAVTTEWALTHCNEGVMSRQSPLILKLLYGLKTCMDEMTINVVFGEEFGGKLSIFNVSINREIDLN